MHPTTMKKNQQMEKNQPQPQPKEPGKEEIHLDDLSVDDAGAQDVTGGNRTPDLDSAWYRRSYRYY